MSSIAAPSILFDQILFGLKIIWLKDSQTEAIIAVVWSFRTTSRLPARVWVLTSVVTVVGTQAVVPGVLLLDIARTLQVTPGLLGTIFACYGLALGGTSFIAASVFATASLRTRLTTGLFLLAAALIVIGASSSWAMVLVGVLAGGVGAGVALPAVYALVPSLVGDDQIARGMSRALLGWAMAFVIGVPIAGIIAACSDWRVSFFVLAAATALTGAATKGLPAETTMPVSIGNATAVFRDRSITLLLIGVAVFMATFYGSFAFVGSAARAQLHEGPWLSSLIALVYGAGFGLGSAAARWAERHERALLSIGFAALAVIYALLPAATHLLTAILALTVVWGFTNEVSLTSLLARIGRHPQSTYALALYNTVTYVSAAIGTAGAGTLLAARGFSAVGLIAAAVTVGGLVVVVAARGGPATERAVGLEPQG